MPVVQRETGHLLRLASSRPCQRTERLLPSIAALLGLELDLGIPDHTTFSRRSPDWGRCNLASASSWLSGVLVPYLRTGADGSAGLVASTML